MILLPGAEGFVFPKQNRLQQFGVRCEQKVSSRMKLPARLSGCCYHYAMVYNQEMEKKM